MTYQQVRKLKHVTAKYQKQVTEEVKQSRDKIRQGLYLSDIAKGIKDIDMAIQFVRNDKIELAAIKLDDIGRILNDGNLTKILNNDLQDKLGVVISRFEDGYNTMVSKSPKTINSIKKEFLLEVLSNTKSVFGHIENSLKSSLYGNIK